MRVLLTGGAGFIGGHLAGHLLAKRHDVVIADRFSYAGKARNLGADLADVDLLIGDLSQGDLPARCVEVSPEVVIHLAAETHVDRSIMDPQTFLYSNAIGTSRLLDAFARSPVHPRFVIYSTDEVYGPTPWGKLYDEDERYNPSNAYSASKMAVEGIANAFRVTHKLDIMVVRPCNVYGPRQHPEKAIPKWIGQLLRGDRATLYNDGKGFRDWMHVNDHGAAILAVILRGETGSVYNLAREDLHTDAEVLEQVCELLDKDFERSHTFVQGRPGHDRGYAMTGRRLRKLGWQPSVEFAEGLAAQVEWTVAHPDWWAHDAVRLA